MVTSNPFATRQGEEPEGPHPVAGRRAANLPRAIAAADLYDSPVGYRLEYVSGGVFTRTYPVTVLFHVINRGKTEEHVRAHLWGEWGLSYLYPPAGVLFDSEDAIVAPGDAWQAFTDEIGFDPFLFTLMWARIYTTSPNLVPSATFWDPLAGNRPAQRTVDGEQTLVVQRDVNVPFVYYSPGDFAQFELRPRLIDTPGDIEPPGDVLTEP